MAFSYPKIPSFFSKYGDFTPLFSRGFQYILVPVKKNMELTPKKAGFSRRCLVQPFRRRFPKGKNPSGAVLDARHHYLKES
jgi:hypothetical protein